MDWFRILLSALQVALVFSIIWAYWRLRRTERELQGHRDALKAIFEESQESIKPLLAIVSEVYGPKRYITRGRLEELLGANKEDSDS